MRIVSGSLDRTIKVHSTNTKKQHILLYTPKKVWGDKTSAYCIVYSRKGVGSEQPGLPAHHGLDVWRRPHWCCSMSSGR